MKITGKKIINLSCLFLFTAFIGISFKTGFIPGLEIGKNFISFSFEMLKILPCAFVLIGIFEVWVKKEKIEKHLGKSSGFMAYIWMVLFAGTTVGGLYVAFPVAYSLYNKGAKLGAVFTYTAASGICRVPMTLFEASFMGIKFSVIRLVVSIPLVILSSMVLGYYLEKKDYRLTKVE